MNLIIVKNILKKSRVFNFNVVERDLWIKKQASSIEPNSKVLDIGAGSSPYRKYFSHCNYVTQDFCQLEPSQLRFGSGYSLIDIVSNAEQIPVDDCTFDVILLTEVIEHVPNPIEVLKEASRILKDDGVLILTAPLGSGLHQQPYHFYGGYTPYWYRKFLSEFGFMNIEVISNGNFFKLFGQEFQRFIEYTNPIKFTHNIIIKILWTPVWFILAPFWFIIPLFMNLIDKYDSLQYFTVGYHVRAIKKHRKHNN
jgi:SAM-dependent methyltransferase